MVLFEPWIRRTLLSLNRIRVLWYMPRGSRYRWNAKFVPLMVQVTSEAGTGVFTVLMAWSCNLGNFSDQDVKILG
jgi:hypothetical protein